MMLGRWHSDEVHAAILKLMKPLLDKYGVPQGAQSRQDDSLVASTV